MSRVRSRTGASLAGSGASVASFVGSPILSQIQVKATGLGFCAYGTHEEFLFVTIANNPIHEMVGAQPGCVSIYVQLFMQFHTLSVLRMLL